MKLYDLNGNLLEAVQFRDENGLAYGIRHADNKPRVSSTPYLYDIAEGNVANHDSLMKFGANNSVGNSEETIWTAGELYAYLTSAEQLQVSSGDVDDQGSDLTSGTSTTLTGGSTTTIVDTNGDFVNDTVAAGDLFINDTNKEHGIVKTVTDGQNIILELPTDTSNDSGDTYRIINANDTGAAVVKLFGLDSSYAEISEYVVLATGASVATSASFLRIFRAFVVIAGSSGFNEGLISIKNNADAVTLAQIDAQLCQTLMCLWTVPASRTFFMAVFWTSEINNKKAEVRLYSRRLGEVFQLKMDTGVVAGHVHHEMVLPMKILQKTDIEVRGVSTAVGAEVSAGFDGWYET